MRRAVDTVSICCLLVVALTSCATAATSHVYKVLPQLLDLKGRHALTPSLYDRDAYQASQRQHPEAVSGVQFNVNWKAHVANDAKLKLRVEVRGEAKGITSTESTVEKEVQPGRSRQWTAITLTGDGFKKLGGVTAWRVTLWNGDELLGEQKSFLW